MRSRWCSNHGPASPTAISLTTTLYSRQVWCQALHVVTHYFLLSNYCWMLAEGLYLHTVLVNAFGAEERLVKWLYLLGWALPVPIITLYAVWRGCDHTATQRYVPALLTVHGKRKVLFP